LSIVLGSTAFVAARTLTLALGSVFDCRLKIAFCIFTIFSVFGLNRSSDNRPELSFFYGAAVVVVVVVVVVCGIKTRLYSDTILIFGIERDSGEDRK
jgi:hypothetical protein